MALICFDLDGTLVNPLRAITHCAELTFRELGLAPPSREQLAPHIGFGAGELFADRPEFADPDRLAAALAIYWRFFEAEGIVKHRVYDNVPLLMARLKRQGHRLYAVTVKPTRFARQVLHQFDLLLAFDDVFGTRPQQPWTSKTEVLAEVRAQGALEPGGFMVGDRADDISAGRTNGLRSLGVTWGFGSAEELREAGAEALFGSVLELDEWFRNRLTDPERHDAFTRSE